MTASLAIGLEQGALALLGSKSSRALLTLVSHDELILLCCALLAVTSAIPREVALVGRMSTLMGHVFTTIALNTALAGVVVDSDPALTCANLLSVYFLGMAVHQEDAGLAAQYLLVSNLSQALRQGVQESLGVAWALVTVPVTLVGIGEDLQQLARLVTVETFTGFLRTHLPSGGLLATTLLLLYLTAPFVEQFPVLVRVNRFAVFAVSNDMQLQGVSTWLIAACLWGLWQADPEPTGKAFAASAGGSVAVLAVLDAIRYAMDNDPAPVLVSLLVAIQILQF